MTNNLYEEYDDDEDESANDKNSKKKGLFNKFFGN